MISLATHERSAAGRVVIRSRPDTAHRRRSVQGACLPIDLGQGGLEYLPLVASVRAVDVWKPEQFCVGADGPEESDGPVELYGRGIDVTGLPSRGVRRPVIIGP